MKLLSEHISTLLSMETSNGSWIFVREETISENNITYTHRIQRYIPDPKPISIGWNVEISCILWFLWDFVFHAAFVHERVQKLAKNP